MLVTLVLCMSAFEIAAHAWRLCLYLEIVAVYRNPFAPDRVRWLYPVVVLVIALASATAIGFATRLLPHLGSLSLHEVEEKTLVALGIAFVYVPSVLFAALGFILHAVVRLLVSQATLWSARHAAPRSISFLARQRVMRHGTAYLVLHGGQLVGALAILLVSPGPYASLAWHALALAICGRPVLSLLGWLVINDVIYLCTPPRPPQSAHAGAGGALTRPSCQRSILSTTDCPPAPQ